MGGPQYVQSMLDQLEETQGQHGVERSERRKVVKTKEWSEQIGVSAFSE